LLSHDPLAPVSTGTRALRWVSPSPSAPAESLITLEIANGWETKAVAEVGGREYALKQSLSGWTLREQESAGKETRLRGKLITTAEGEKFRFETVSFWRGRFRVLDREGHPILHVARRWSLQGEGSVCAVEADPRAASAKARSELILIASARAFVGDPFVYRTGRDRLFPALFWSGWLIFMLADAGWLMGVGALTALAGIWGELRVAAPTRLHLVDAPDASSATARAEPCTG
jgi:hypothetical protein